MPQHWVRLVTVVAAIVFAVGLAQPATVDARSAAIKQANSTLHLSLPWAKGQAWRITGGPHANDGSGRPWSSLDFNGPNAGGSYRVRAAAAGVVTRPCRNLVQIKHGNGWKTSYYHLAHIKVRAGQHVKRGQVLGFTSTKAGCGGSATGPHVHFGLKHWNHWVDIEGLKIGGWVVRESSQEYVGWMVHSGTWKYAPGSRLRNYGGS